MVFHEESEGFCRGSEAFSRKWLRLFAIGNEDFSQRELTLVLRGAEYFFRKTLDLCARVWYNNSIR